jgi:hypothetical protein
LSPSRPQEGRSHRTPRADLPLESVLCAVNARLRCKPFVRAGQLLFARDVLAPHWTVRPGAAAPANRHSSVGLGKMMFV